jgi:hypothetical protein
LMGLDGEVGIGIIRKGAMIKGFGSPPTMPDTNRTSAERVEVTAAGLS